MATNGTNGTRKSIRAPNPPVEDSIFKSFRLDGRTVIISGGSGGIGYEVARGLAEAGANVSLIRSFTSASNSQLLDRTLVLRLPRRRQTSRPNNSRLRRQDGNLPSPSRKIRRSRSRSSSGRQRFRASRCHDCKCRYPFQSRRIRF